MTVCNGCGSCCDPVVLPFTQDEALKSDLSPEIKHWVTKVLVPMKPREAKAREPFIFDRPHIATRPDEVLVFTYRCTWFDEERRRCSNHEGRPPGCRLYPWKSGQPDPTAALPPTCSFRADIGQEVEPTFLDAPVHFVRRNRAK